ncbi:MAG TPA: PAS domain S-box protein, partial [Blastocatellia bacterium]|nr:PAS domain S-box protein [Blastocatellia bacterium]
IYWNNAAEQLYHVPASEAVGRRIEEVYQYKWLKAEDEQAAECSLATTGSWQGENIVITRDNDEIYVESSVSAIKDEGGAATGRLAVIRDISERKRAEESLRESEARRLLAERAARMGTFEWNIKTGLNIWSPELEAMYGLPIGSFAGTQPAWESLVYSDDRDRALASVQRAFETCEPVEEEWRVRWPDGSIHWLFGRFQVFLDSSGAPLKLTGINIDITKRKAAEEALRESESRNRAILNALPDLMFLQNSDGIYLDYHAKNRSDLLIQPEEFIGKRTEEILPPELATPLSRCFENALKTDETQLLEYSLNIEGQDRHYEARVVKCDSDKVLSIVREITQTRQAEDQLRAQAILLDHAREAIIVRDLNDRILFWNRGAESIYGWTASETIGRDIREILYKQDPTEYERAKTNVLDKGEWAGELLQFTKSGKEIIVESRWTFVPDYAGEPKAILAINTDITEKKSLEAQFLSAQRMESIGTLAAGISHDLINVLTPILMAINVLQIRLKDEESLRMLEVIERSAQWGADLARQVLDFVRGTEGERTDLQLKYLIKDLIMVLKKILPKSIEVEANIPEDLWVVSGDATQLHQVLLNLSVNARDAMPGGGILTIKAENTLLDETYARMRVGIRPGPFVSISVTDTGTGIPSGIAEKIFDPFFTTKERGKGTGLGLSTVLAIVNSHGGFINVSSRPGKGTEFKFYLPAAKQKAEKQAPEDIGRLPRGHAECILIVDDEASIREIAKATLEAYGYQVKLAADGTEALALYAQHRNEIKLVILDMVMPIMDGPSTIRALRRLNAQVKIIASSGLEEYRVKSAEGGVIRFLWKPFTAEDLLIAINAALRSDQEEAV